jgi:diguanylate cyclase (GGDEF)-like protein
MINTPSSLQEMIVQLNSWRGLAQERPQADEAILEEVKAAQLIDAQAPQADKATAGSQPISLLDQTKELYNCSTLLKELQVQLEESKSKDCQVAMCVIAIDGFDVIVEKYGALAADAVTQVVAKAVSAELPEKSLLGRYNKQQLILVLLDMDATAASLLADRLREGISSQAIAHNWQRFSVTASVGIAFFPDQAQEHNELIALAIKAARSAIARGGDRVVVV